MNPSKETIAKYKKTICEIAKAFDTFCTRYDLRYFCIGGTAIGALRHKGIIPWDDDIDFVMPRPDYERFLTLAEEQLEERYEVFTYRNHQDFQMPFAKMCDANTTLLGGSWYKCVIGAFVDIFPMDGVPEGNEQDQIVYFEERVRLRNTAIAINSHYPWRYLLSCVKRYNFQDTKNFFISKWYHLLKKRNNLFEKNEKIMMQNSFDESEFVAYYGTNRGNKVISPREWFEDYYYVPFEDFQLRLPVGIHQYLTRVYGDYMSPPPVDKRIPLHSYYFLDLERRLDYQEVVRILKK